MTPTATSVALLARSARRYAERPFLHVLLHDGTLETLSYRQGAARIVGIADWLLHWGLQKGDRVGAYFDEGNPGVWFELACAAAGIVSVPLGPSYSVDALHRLCVQAGARAIFTVHAHTEAVSALGLPTFTLDGGAALQIEPIASPDPLARLDALAAEVGPDDLYMLQQTSGSTGAPKLVMRRNVTMPFAGDVVAGGLTEDDDVSLLLTLSLTHGGAHYALHSQIGIGGALALSPGVDTGIALADVERLAPTHVFLTPRVLRVFLRAHEARYGEAAPATPFLSKRLRGINIGGASPDPSMIVELTRRGIGVSEAYGATEMSLVAVSNYGERQPGLVGHLLPDVEIRIADDHELLVRSPYAMAGLWGDEALTKAAFDADGFYRSGDLAAVEDGQLRILGRKRDVFNSSEGSNIYPARIEEALEALPDVAQACVVGDNLPYLVALVVLRGTSGDPAELLEDDARRTALAASITTMNEKLEQFERVKRFAILAGPFDASVYRAVGQGKVARNRKELVARHGDLVGRLYAKDESAFDVA